MTNGTRTSELWVTAIGGILAAVLPLLVAYGVLTSDLAEMWKGLIMAIVAAIVPLVTGLLARNYTNARTEIKVEALNLEREVVSLELLRLEALGNE